MNILAPITHWFQKRISALGSAVVAREQQTRINALLGADPDVITRAITAFDCGTLAPLARLVEAYERRDDKMMTCSMKMKASVGRCDYSILPREGFEGDARAARHAEILKRFWSGIKTTSRFKMNERGGIGLLKKQMMNAQSYGFAVHELVWTPLPNGELTCTFIEVPLWHFENRTGELRFLPEETAYDGIIMREGEWMVSTGDGIGIAAAICACLKRLTLADWAVFCQRCGMPVIIGKTGAAPGSEQWDNLNAALRAIGRDARIQVDTATDISAINVGGGSAQPYTPLVEWADRAIAALYRGADLSTISQGGDGVGASLQGDETGMLEQDACNRLSETLHEQVERFVIRYVTGDDEPLAHIVIAPVSKQNVDEDIKIDQHLVSLGAKLSKNDALQRYGRTEADPEDPEDAPLSAPQPQPGLGGFANEVPTPSGTRPLADEQPTLSNPTQGESGSNALLQAFASDTGAAAEAVKRLLENPTPEGAAALLKELPSLIPEDPALAAVIAEAMAAEFCSVPSAKAGGMANELNDDEWEIVDIDEIELIANAKGICSSPNGVEGCGSDTCPGKSATQDEQDADTSRKLVEIANSPSAEPVMIPRPEGLETQLRVDPKAANHIVSRRNQQRAKRISRAKESGDAAELAKAEAMMTGEQILEILPGESRKGKVVGRHFDENQGKEIVDIDTPRLHIAAQKKRPSRKHRQGDKEFGVSTTFPPDEEFAKKTKRGGR